MSIFMIKLREQYLHTHPVHVAFQYVVFVWSEARFPLISVLIQHGWTDEREPTPTADGGKRCDSLSKEVVQNPILSESHPVGCSTA